MNREDYLKYAGDITEKLENTNEYSLWLLIQHYADEMYFALECAKVGLNKEKSTKEKSLQALNEIRKYINTNEIMNNEGGTFLLKECYYGQEILEKIDKVLGEEKC